jgi:SAM-dependent methyltransferase
MAFEYEDLRTILPALATLEHKRELLVLGDATFHVGPSAYASLAAEANIELAFVPSNLDPSSFGESLGFKQTETLDANGKASINANLNEEVAPELAGRFDCVIDAGVLFWCFDPAAVFRNVLRMTRPGGIIAHITAISGHYGRGYYNVHPLAFEDFYLLNGCRYLGASFRPKFRSWRVVDGVLRRLGM